MIWDEYAYLMADMELVDQEEGVRMVRCEAYKHPDNPLVEGGKGIARAAAKDPARLCGTPICVARDGGTYRGWFGFARNTFGNHFTYGESDDGIHFKPKTVGTTEYRGSKKNNLVTFTENPDLKNCGMMYDPMDSEYPYKTVVMRRGGREDFNRGVAAKAPGLWEGWGHHPSLGWFVSGLGRSRDGFNWEMPPEGQTLIDEIIEEPVVHRALDGGYAIGNQMVTQASDIGFRKVKCWVTYDGRKADRIPDYTFKLPDHMTMVFRRWLGKTSQEEHPWVQSHVQLIPMRKGPSMFTLHGYLYGAPKIDRYACTYDVGLAVSSTGYSFRQVWPFRPFLRRGDMGAWDCTSVRQAGSIVETKDQTLFYYAGGQGGNARTDPRHYRHGWGVASVEKDRLGFYAIWQNVDYEKKARDGLLTMKPVTLPRNPEISANVANCTRTRHLTFELRTKSGRPVPGLSFKDSLPVTGSGLRRHVRWKKAHVKQLAGKEVIIAVKFFSPDCLYPYLHSFVHQKVLMMLFLQDCGNSCIDSHCRQDQ